jgi:hypothetical protein
MQGFLSVKRGPKSSNEIATVVLRAGKQMPFPPPSELSDAQAMIWRDTVAAMPGDWLTRAGFPILIAYCRHSCRARLLEMQIATFEIEWTKVEGGLERFDKMLSMAERETRALSACARALRLTPQATMHPRTAGRALSNHSTGPRPWD